MNAKWWENVAFLEFLTGYSVEPPVRRVHPTPYRKELLRFGASGIRCVSWDIRQDACHDAAMSNEERFMMMSADLAAAGIP